MPMALTHRLLDWYAGHARALPWRRAPGEPLPTDAYWPYRVWLSEIMLQQTTVEAVRPYFAAFTQRWPSVATLAAAEDAEVMHAWAGLGYYARARNLLACARTVATDHGGQFPATEAALRTLPGIGAYSAAAIAAFAFGQRAIVIDGNVERVITRLADIHTPLPAARLEIAATLETLTPDGLAAADFAQALMDLARSICTPRAPKCLVCPLRPECSATDPETLPVKPAKRARPVRHGTVWWLEAAGDVLTITRPPSGLLGGMAALPSSDWLESPVEATPPVRGNWRSFGRVFHGFTHFELQLDVAALFLPERPEVAGEWAGEWRPRASLASGLPTAFAKAVTRVLANTPATTEPA
ncbi:A/G-specific adenine glycosylase [Polymorphobacter multimanifer]|uniref:A/G-specific adenine glycosylase n=1 Tax=Polymorphobacter multimanifer TaxID=1070431 RepID=UPI001667750F|nr:A/G-specific adenine glycosylase [Polymorphobacter multimanifer]GGI70713.1 A/G-specific adenine glycosylase [Polymorphobacter multimanifer]